tara:strand:+ start:929 stop:2368 length:1440 start_codon:yes stop_codon:yes gene_type:complete
MTGVPMPADAMSRMQMAPEVYKFTKDFARKPNILEKTGNLVKTLGAMGLRGIGEGYKQSQANEQRALQEQLRNQADVMQSEAVTMENLVEEVADTPAMAKIKLQMKADAEKHQQKLELQDRMDRRALGKGSGVSRVVQTSLNPVPMDDYQSLLNPTTADSYAQDYVPNQTATNIVDRKLSQGSQIADSTPNIAEVLSESQDSQPSEEMIGEVGKDQLAKFLSQKGLDQALLGAIGERMEIEQMIGDDSPLLDHPDVVGGEDDNTIPGSMNTGATVNLNQRRNEVENMIRRGAATLSPKQQEDVIDKMISPGDRQVNLLKEREMANEEAIASGFMNLDDEGRRRESIRMGSIGGIPNKTDMQEIRKDPEYIAAQESMLPKTTLEKADQLTTKIMPNKRSSFVESMNLDLSADKAPTATFNLNDNTGGTNPYSVEISTPMAVSLNEMVEDNSLPKESFGKLFNLAKKSIKDKTGMAYGIDQ